MTTDQVKLLKDIEDHFDPGADIGDLMILYEMTGFKLESQRSVEWFD